MLIYGKNVVLEALHAKRKFYKLYVDTKMKDVTFLSIIKKFDVAITHQSKEQLHNLVLQSNHQGVVADVEDYKVYTLEDLLKEEISKLVVLDSIEDPHNLGACLRTADAAGVHAVIAPKDRAVGLSAVVERVACGAAQSVPYLMVTNLARTLRDLKSRGIWVVGTDEAAEQTPDQVDLTLPTAWVMGAEGEGMRRLTRELCDVTVRIPMAGSVESLNVSVATGVCLFEAVRQRRSTPR
jgi:23S rRNA (guanosine2251-2'-O)-methyltransferase